jgi:acetylornithine deacetylase/succinyl-diaminopimelate desuccinylase-like protein
MTDTARERLLAAIRRDRDRAVELAQSVVRVPSPNPPGDSVAIADTARALLSRVPGAAVEVVSAEAPIVNIVARVQGKKPGRRLVFNGHLDTFPVGDASAWTHDPFGGVVADGRLYGRGISDMKAGMACSILAFERLADCRDDWSGEVILALAADEESMGPLGSKLLLDTVPGVKGDAMICGDAGSPRVVRFGEKGLMWVEIEAVGRPGHGAHVHMGENAIDRLRAALDGLAALRRIRPDAPASVTEAIRRSRAISEKISGAGEAGTLGRVTVNIGTISGGISPNLIPASARAAADIRLPVGVTLAEIEGRIADALGKVPGVTWRILRRFEPNWTDPGSEIVRLTAANAARATGAKVAVNMRVGASDARWFRLAGVPTVVYGLTPHHMGGPDEHVMVEEIHQVAEVHAMTAFDFLRVP